MATALSASRREQAPEDPPQNRQRAEGFGVVDFGDDADVVFGQPFPGADDGHAAVVAVAFDVDAGALGDRCSGRMRERQLVSADGRAIARGDVAAGIADEELRIERESS